MNRVLFTVMLMLVSQLANASVSIKIEKLLNQSDTIEFTVTNIDNVAHTTYIGVTVEKKVNGKWESIRWDTDCPCRAKCKKAVTNLGVNKSKKHIWDKKDFSCKAVESGGYRFIVFGSWNIDTNKNDVIGKSNEFKLR